LKSISKNILKSGYKGLLSKWKLVVFDGLTLDNKLTLLITFYFSSTL